MSTSSVNVCTYCFRPREFALGWHGCEQSKKAQATIGGHIEAITAIAARQPRMSEPWDPGRPQRFKDMARSILISGGKVRPEI